MPLVSVIVPVHNMHSYLHQCLESIAAQSLHDIEILVIDDYSTDNSQMVAADFAASDSRVRIFSNQQQMRLYQTRKIGALNARAPMIQFVDADDWLQPDATRLLYEAMTNFNVDLVQMRMMRIVQKVKSSYGIAINPELENRRISNGEFRMLASYIGMDSYISPSCCNKLYRTELLRNSFHIDYGQFWGEDQAVNLQYMREARSMAFIDYQGYNYRWGGESSKYKYSMLDGYKNVWYLKKLLGQEREYIDSELQDLLRYHIRQTFTELAWTRKAVEHKIIKELQDPIWHEVGLDIDAQTLIDEEMAKIKSKPFRYLIKRLIR